jgi:hypothetical protein
MNPAGRSSVGITFRTRKLGLLGAMVVSAAAYGMVPTPATAAAINYSLSGAMATFPDPSGIVTLTGTFVFDLTTDDLVSVDIIASSSEDILSQSPEVFDTPIVAKGFEFTAETSALEPDQMTLVFSADLSNAPAMITAVDLVTDVKTVGSSSSASGSAVPSIPEPTSLALLAGVLALFLFARRANQCDRRA